VEGDATCCWEPNGGSVESRSLPEIARGVNQKARRDYEDAGGEPGLSEPTPEHGCGGLGVFRRKGKQRGWRGKLAAVGGSRKEARVSGGD
jgi:hypothetical protein